MYNAMNKIIIIALFNFSIALASSIAREDNCPTCNGNPLPSGQACCNGTTAYDPNIQKCCYGLVEFLSFKCCSPAQKAAYAQQEQACEAAAAVLYADSINLANTDYQNSVISINNEYQNDLAHCYLISDHKSEDNCISIAEMGHNTSLDLALINKNAAIQRAANSQIIDDKNCVSTEMSMCDNW